MIEIVCNGNNGNGENKNDKKEKSIRVPKNIKQIGDVNSEKKIYIEDYAFSYINSLAYGAKEEQAGVLLGECQKSDTEKCMFIKGVIKAKNDEENENQNIYFNEKIWDKVYSEIEKYFPDLQVVGWFVAVETLTDEKLRFLKKVHMDNFAGGMKTMYLINTTEKEENFYLCENNEMIKQSGYVCFYERNYQMQEYMLEKRGKRMVESPEKDKVMKSIRNIISEKEEIKLQKKNITFMYGLSTFMAVVIFVVGINLMNSYEKMADFDKSLNNIALEISSLNQNDMAALGNNKNSDGEAVAVNKVPGDVYPTQTQKQTQPNIIESETTNIQETTQEQTQTKAAETQSVTVVQAENTKVTEAAADYTMYTVKKGDTVLSICKAVYGDGSRLSEVIELNNMDDANKLYIGQEIKLP